MISYLFYPRIYCGLNDPTQEFSPALTLLAVECDQTKRSSQRIEDVEELSYRNKDEFDIPSPFNVLAIDHNHDGNNRVKSWVNETSAVTFGYHDEQDVAQHLSGPSDIDDSVVDETYDPNGSIRELLSQHQPEMLADHDYCQRILLISAKRGSYSADIYKGYPGPFLTNWLLSRLSFPIALKITKAPALPVLSMNSVQHFARLYSEMTTFSWPESWSELSDLPTDGNNINLFAEYEAFKINAAPLRSLDSDLEPPLIRSFRILSMVQSLGRNSSDKIETTCLKFRALMENFYCFPPSSTVYCSIEDPAFITLSEKRLAKWAQSNVLPRGSIKVEIANDPNRRLLEAQIIHLQRHESFLGHQINEYRDPDGSYNAVAESVLKGIFHANEWGNILKELRAGDVKALIPSEVVFDHDELFAAHCDARLLVQCAMDTKDLDEAAIRSVQNYLGRVYWDYEAPKASSGSPDLSVIDVRLPTLVMVVGEPHEDMDDTIKYCNTLCVASVDFLADLEIESMPVFGLAVVGSECTIIAAGRSAVVDRDGLDIPKASQAADSSTSAANFIFNHGVRTLDISKSLDMYHFCIFLLYIRRHFALAYGDIVSRPEFKQRLRTVATKKGGEN